MRRRARSGIPGRCWIPVLGGLSLLIPAACARQGAPPGGEEDRVPPVVLETRPDTFEALEVVDDRIRIVFNERISERPTTGELNEAVMVSPAFGEVTVSHARDALEVDMSGGFRPGYVYRVTVRPVIRDMFGNTLREPFEFAFSTGGEFHPGVVAGLVLDRITGEQVQDARVELTPPARTGNAAPGDSVVYLSRTDTSGIFAVRFLPGEVYDLLAWVDRDRDRQAGPLETQGRTTVTLVEGDTLLTDVVLVQPDTSPARLGRTQAMDPVTLLLTFDDHLDPEVPVAGLDVGLGPDSTTPPDAPAPPEVEGVFHAREYFQFMDSLARQDSIARAAREDSLALAEEADTTEVSEADTLEGEGTDTSAVADTVTPPPAAGPARAAAGRDSVRPEIPSEENSLLEVPLPTTYLVVVLEDTLPAGIPYRVTVEGVTNLAGTPGGGGSVVVARPEPPPDTLGPGPGAEMSDTVAGDTAAVMEAVDTAAPDTLQADTLQADTLQTDTLQTDTLQADTLPPDGLRQVTLRPYALRRGAFRPDALRPDASSRASSRPGREPRRRVSPNALTRPPFRPGPVSACGKP